MAPDQPIINRVLLKYGAMFDTTLTEEEFTAMLHTTTPGLEVEIIGVFGEKLIVRAEDLLGFISRKDLDVEKAMAAAAAMAEQRRSPSPLASPGTGRPY